jgi:hypothetical protein
VDCNKIREFADDYVFGLLEPAQERNFQAHIDSCEACAAVIAEARSRREAFSTWNAPGANGAADRLLIRIRSGKAALPPGKTGLLLVRVLAAAAVILAAVVLPMLFMARQPEVLGYEPQMTSVVSKFNRHVIQELIVPTAVVKNSCIVVRLCSTNTEEALKTIVRLNNSQAIEVVGDSIHNEQTVILTHEHGLREGRNLLKMRNLGQTQVEFEVTLVAGKNK